MQVVCNSFRPFQKAESWEWNEKKKKVSFLKGETGEWNGKKEESFIPKRRNRRMEWKKRRKFHSKMEKSGNGMRKKKKVSFPHAEKLEWNEKIEEYFIPTRRNRRAE